MRQSKCTGRFHEALGPRARSLRRRIRDRLMQLLLLICLTAYLPLPAQAQSTPKIVNGILSFEHPSVAGLFGQQYFCTATLVGCETLLTSAHCVCVEDFTGSQCQPAGTGAPVPQDHVVFFQNAGFFDVSEIIVHSGYDFPYADLALIKLSSPVIGIAPTPINTTGSPEFATAASIVGYGTTGGVERNAGLKREGAISTTSCGTPEDDEDFICWNFDAPIGPPGEDSTICNGDSGGPLLVEVGGESQLAGVNCGQICPTNDCLPPAFSIAQNVFSYRDWIQTNAGSDLDQTSCGDIPQVGDPGTKVIGFVGSVDGSAPEDSYPFSIPSGSSVLRVGLNGQIPIEANLADFDLFLAANKLPTPSMWDCASNTNWAFEYCEIDAPDSVDWGALVSRVAGSGDYQLTVTTIPEPTGAAPLFAALATVCLVTRSRNRSFLPICDDFLRE